MRLPPPLNFLKNQQCLVCSPSPVRKGLMTSCFLWNGKAHRISHPLCPNIVLHEWIWWRLYYFKNVNIIEIVFVEEVPFNYVFFWKQHFQILYLEITQIVGSYIHNRTWGMVLNILGNNVITWSHGGGKCTQQGTQPNLVNIWFIQSVH
jgi:hypothetical protein